MNKFIDKYESSFARFCGARYAFSFWKGRVALYAVLKAMDVGKSDEVILPGYTCVMNVNPIKYLGAKPIYVDIEPATFNMDVRFLERKISSNTKVIIAQHTYGYPCNMDAIMDISRRTGIAVIEDCCLALGSRYKGKMVGTFGAASYFSFQWNKPFTTGLGGMLVTNDLQLANKISELYQRELCWPSAKEVMMLAAQFAIYRNFVYPRTAAIARSIFRYLIKKRMVVGSSSASEYEPVMAGDFFKGMSSFQAWVGLGQLEYVEKNIAHRRKMAQLYDQLLEEEGWVAREYNRAIMEPVMVRYPVRINEKHKALAEAAKAGVELGSWFECPLHPIRTPLEAYDYEIGMCPEAEKASNEVVNLPLHLRVDERTAKKTVEFITRFTKVI